MEKRRFISLMMLLLATFATASGIDPATQRFLDRLAYSEASNFQFTSDTVFDLEADLYKVGNIIYSSKAIVTTNGQQTEVITRNTQRSRIRGFTQISPKSIVMADQHCLRRVDRMTGKSSVLAGQYNTSGHQDGIGNSALFYHPWNIINNKMNEGQILVGDPSNQAIRTVDIKTTVVGTFFKSKQIRGLRELEQEGKSGDIYITDHYLGLHKISYVTRQLTAIKSSSGHQIYSEGLLVLDTSTLLAALPRNNSAIVYNIDRGTTEGANICVKGKSSNKFDLCGIATPYSILRFRGSLLVGTSDKRIIEYKPTALPDKLLTKKLAKSTTTTTPTAASTTTPRTTSTTTPTPSTRPVVKCSSRNVTVSLDKALGTAKVKITPDVTADLSRGNHMFAVSDTENNMCTVRVVVTWNQDISEEHSCPEEIVSVTSPVDNLARFELKTANRRHTLLLPIGRYPYIIELDDHQMCNVTLEAADHRVRRTLGFVSTYNADCDKVKDMASSKILEEVATQRYSIIEEMCGKACTRPEGLASPIIRCTDVNKLSIRWPTDLVFSADVTQVPLELLANLQAEITSRGRFLDVVVLGMSPPVVSPLRYSNGDYTKVILSTSCVDGRTYSESDKSCI